MKTNVVDKQEEELMVVSAIQFQKKHKKEKMVESQWDVEKSGLYV